jgi:hypothetical protein
MNRYKVLAAATCLALFAASPSYADKHDNDKHNDGDRHEQRSEQRNEQRHEQRDEHRNEQRYVQRNEQHYDERRDEHRDDHRDERRWENAQRDYHDHDDHGRTTWFHDHGYSRLKIPARYYPAPGQCRLWYPDLPAWRQPAAQWNCGPAPRGAWVIHRPRNDARHVNIVVNEPDYYGSQLIGEFDIGSGTYIRLVTNF